jgi:hypothetical protein
MGGILVVVAGAGAAVACAECMRRAVLGRRLEHVLAEERRPEVEPPR